MCKYCLPYSKFELVHKVNHEHNERVKSKWTKLFGKCILYWALALQSKSCNKTHQSWNPRMGEEEAFNGRACYIPTKLINEIPGKLYDVAHVMPCIGQAALHISDLSNFVQIGFTYETSRTRTSAPASHRGYKYPVIVYN